MAVTVTTSITGPYIPNGATTVFPFDFKAGSADEVDVYRDQGDGWVLVSSADYTASVDPEQEGGTVEFSVAPGTGSGDLYIVSSPFFTREGQYTGEGPFTPKGLNNQFDKAAVRDIALKRDVDRAFKVPLGEDAASLPGKADRASKYLSFDSQGDPVVNSIPTALSVIDVVFTFSTVASMKAAVFLFPGQVVQTKGYYTSGDGGANRYEIVAAGTGTDDGGSYIDLPGSDLQARGIFDGHIVHAEKFGCVNGVEASGQLTKASIFAATVMRPNAAHRQAKLVMASNINSKDKIVIGVAGRQLDVDLQGSTINCVTGGNLTATEPAVTLHGYDSKRFACTVLCNKLTSGWFISGSGSWTERPNARRFASHADAYGVWDDVGNIADASATEWEPSDAEFDTQANFLGRGLVINAKDNYVVNARPAWSKITIHLTSNSGGNTLIGCHPFHGNPHSGAGGMENPSLRFDNPIILKSEASYVVRLIGCYLDNGIVQDMTSHLRMTGGDIFTNGESILTAPRFRIAEQVSGNYDTILDDVVTSVGVMQADMVTASTNYAQWPSVPALQGGAAVKVRQRETNFYTYPSIGSNPLVTDVIGDRTGGYHRRIIFNNGVAVDEVIRSTSWEIRHPFRTCDISDNSGTLYIGNQGSRIFAGGVAGDLVIYRGNNAVWEVNSSLGNLRPSLDNSASLGASARRLADLFTVKAQIGTPTFSPGIGTTLTPAANGDLMIEATSDTSVKIKLKGSDGTVRSATLTLA